jgi:hypothetical protein
MESFLVDLAIKELPSVIAIQEWLLRRDAIASTTYCALRQHSLATTTTCDAVALDVLPQINDERIAISDALLASASSMTTSGVCIGRTISSALAIRPFTFIASLDCSPARVVNEQSK